MPVQYATGRAWFAFDFFEVSPAVLIPRPETEELVRLAARQAATLVHPSILDVGTGSGCIAITLKKWVPQAQVSAIDLSAEALAVARSNAARMDTDVHWQQLNFLDTNSWESLPAYHLIVSNPPYIPPEEALALEPHVTQWEPEIALFTTTPDPLQFYKALAAFGHGHLLPGGWLMVEVHQQYAHDVCTYFEQQGYTVTLHFDVFDNPRMVAASIQGP
jgi:release factor glutamine methyltransferase